MAEEKPTEEASPLELDPTEGNAVETDSTYFGKSALIGMPTATPIIEPNHSSVTHDAINKMTKVTRRFVIKNVPRGLPPDVLKSLADKESKYANICAAIGGSVIIAGAVMAILGLTGAVDLDFDVGNIKIHLKTAVVGVAMAVIGALIIIFTRFNIGFSKK